MTPAAAANLAARITATWRGGPTATIWADELEHLDEGTAGTTYARLRREEEHAPTIAKYLATYRTLHTPAADKPRCDLCDSTGWIETAPLVIVDNRGDERTNTQVIPCIACEYGTQARRIHPAILEFNRRP